MRIDTALPDMKQHLNCGPVDLNSDTEFVMYCQTPDVRYAVISGTKNLAVLVGCKNIRTGHNHDFDVHELCAGSQREEEAPAWLIPQPISFDFRLIKNSAKGLWYTLVGSSPKATSLKPSRSM